MHREALAHGRAILRNPIYALNLRRHQPFTHSPYQGFGQDIDIAGSFAYPSVWRYVFRLLRSSAFFTPTLTTGMSCR